MKLLDGTTAILRLVHIDNLTIYLSRGALHAPSCWPADGRVWRTTHRSDVQARRAKRRVPEPPGGALLDYVPFYFGPRSPMLYQLETGWVPGYTEGQRPMVYLVASAHDVAAAGLDFVFFDGHALTDLSLAFHDLDDLERVDWRAVHARRWSGPGVDPDRQRRKQAEFLVHRMLPWRLVRGLVVLDDGMRDRVDDLLDRHDPSTRRPIEVAPTWYY